MNKVKKGITLLLLVIFMVGIVGSPVSAAKANGDASEGMNKLTEEQKELSIILMDSLEGYTDPNGNVQIKINNKEELEDKLNDSGISGDMISVGEIEKALTQMNYTFSVGDGDTENQLTLSCGSLVTIFGWIHTGNFALAAAALGITGWGAAVPAVLLAGVWAAAGVIGCDLAA